VTDTPQTNAPSLPQALQVLHSDEKHLADALLPRHWMRDFFLASLCLEVQHNAEGLSRLQVGKGRALCPQPTLMQRFAVLRCFQPRSVFCARRSAARRIARLHVCMYVCMSV
jgi:hypothetical protein